MGRISALTELTSLASDDYLVVLDSSANIAKKISIANAFGIVDFGWTASGETWTYSSWDSTRKIGVITVPTDATTKYSAGMRVKITQSTGGTKYGIIHKVETTALTIFFGTDYTLNNETITSPTYSVVKAPYGFPLDPNKWKVEFTDTSDRTQASPTQNVWYNPGTSKVDLGIGIWDLSYQASARIIRSSSVSTGVQSTLSTANNSSTDPEYQAWGEQVGSGNLEHTMPTNKRKVVVLTSNTSYYLNIRNTYSSATSISLLGSTGATTKITAISAYL